MKKYLFFGYITALSLQAIVPTMVVTQSGTMSQPQGDQQLAWVDEQIEAILPSRIGISENFINTLRDPMKLKSLPAASKEVRSPFLAPPKLTMHQPTLIQQPIAPPKIIEEPLRLQAIMNKSVLINGKWYKHNDPVRSYTIGEVRSNSVVLNDAKNQKMILFLTKQNNNIKIITQ
ncbi:MAG: hypothetical protein PHW64_00690 [Sulfuricurvum sp.]|nr:hypothetical protein [Sulfuricurvum sp.]